MEKSDEKGLSAGNAMGKSGEKGLSAGKGAPLKGKGDDSANSAKSRRGRKVQINDGCGLFKGGKGGKGASIGKASGTKEPPKLDLNVMEELSKNAKNAQCMMDCEAAEILQGIQDRIVLLSRDPTIKLPVAFDKGLQYAKSSVQYTSPEAVRQALQTLKEHGVSDAEICVIANTGPETVDETFFLVPTLKSKKSKLAEPLEEILHKLGDLRCPTETFND